LGDLGIAGQIILRKQGLRVQTGFFWPMTETSGVLL
jgi:hypothetical protein